MLKYFYLICLFICITLSYDYDSRSNINPYKVGKSRRFKKIKGIDKKVSHQSSENKIRDAVQHFDVASFVKQAIEDDEPYGFRIKKGRSSNNDDYDIGANSFNNKKRENSRDYLNIGGDDPSELNFNSPVLKEDINPELQNPNGLSLDYMIKNPVKFSRNTVENTNKDYSAVEVGQSHNPTKKCVFSNIRIPFFSHNKSQNLSPKKNKKRKLFCLNCPKNGKKGNTDALKKLGDEQATSMKVKRSHHNLCSSCRRRLRRSDDITEEDKTSTIIHNSRQFYQNIDNKEIPHAKSLDSNNREKREEQDQERQIKELEEVQKKIDAVEIRIPSFDGKPESLE